MADLIQSPNIGPGNVRRGRKALSPHAGLHAGHCSHEVAHRDGKALHLLRAQRAGRQLGATICTCIWHDFICPCLDITLHCMHTCNGLQYLNEVGIFCLADNMLT